ncbi:filamentous hemagglutinin N-terminal domain-containing protein [Albimonas pacifica]|uniref:Filamentous hemagglutinin family N-terminal domain-containing protein n=1 Tax=Albimonas pacifica TaxID=1114924 RepID=A0A1I3K6Y7_9RHOB|nr:filamentous hemagglutinin N-terminal domain-containing protein [Albimonas pacifica]SFI68068.1 filamentous hemagglutinin family N-terminal domain-containing protein [Albimonas pacifica]
MALAFRVPFARVSSPRARSALMAGAAAAAMAAGLAAPATAGPSGGTVKGGEATITTRGDLTVVRQGSRRVIIDWTSFDIGADEAVKFLQPGRQAVALNRVLDGLPTHIRGKLTANGNVWLVNPSGVMFHAGSVVDVGGLVATTADIDDRDFMNGGGRFDTPGKPGARIVNEGTITFAEAGMVGLVAPEVANRGVIAGQMGKIVVAGQESFSVDVSGDGLFEIDLADAARTRGARAENSGVLIAEGGTVIITAAAARDAVEAAVSVGGVIEAQSARVDGGTIVLDGGAGDVVVTGRLDASGGAGTRGGKVDVTGGTVRIAKGASIDVSGGLGGGAARIGGAARGAGPAQGGLRAAEVTVLEAGASIDADATVEGDGGEVVLWSTAATWMGGRITARGAGAGDGGFAEVSSLGGLGFSGRVDLSSPGGTPGLLLLDPRDVRIVATDDDAFVFSGEILVDQLPGEDLVVLASAISNAASDVVIEASRDISVEAAISSRRPGVSLSLLAGRDLLLGASIVMRGDLTLAADADFTAQPSDGVGAIRALGTLRLESSFAALGLSAAEGIDGSAMAATDVLSLVTSEALTLPDAALAGELETRSLGPAVAGAIAAHGLRMEALSLTLGGPVAVAGESALTTSGGTIAALNAGNAFGGAVALDTTGGGIAAPGDAALRSGGDLTLGAGTVDALALEVGGALSQTGALSVAGDATLAAGSIDLSFSDNAFEGVVAVESKGLASLADADAIRLGQVRAGELVVAVQDGVSQAAGTRVSVAGATTATTQGGAVTLGASGNVFGGDVAVDTTLLGASAADVTVVASGALSLGGIVADGLTLRAGDTISQTGAILAGGASVLQAFAIDLTFAGNRFDGPVTALAAGSVALADADALRLGAVQAGALSLSAGGTIDQQAGAMLNVAGESVIRSAGGDVVLGEATNSFGGAVRVEAAGDALLAAAGDLRLSGAAVDRLTLDVTGRATQSGALTLLSGLDVEASLVTFSNAANDLGDLVDVRTPGAASLADAGAMRLGAVEAGSLTLAAGGAIDQAAGAALEVAGASSVRTSGGAVTLDAAGNVFGGGLGVATDLGGAPAAHVSVATGGALLLAGVSADLLTVEAGGALTQSGALQLGAGADLTAASFTLLNASNAFGSVLRLDGGAASLRASGGVTFGASSLASLALTAGGDVGQVGALQIAGTARFETPGDVILEAANAFDGAVSISGAAVSVTDADSLALVSVEAGETLTARALGGDLSMEQVRVGGGAGALWGGADGGSIWLVSALAGDTVLAGAEGPAAQDIHVDTAALGSLQAVAAGGGGFDGVRLSNLVLAGDLGVALAPNVSLDGVTLGTDAVFDPGAVSGTLSLHRVRTAGDLVASVEGDVRLGLVETRAGREGAGTLDIASGGTIAKLADAAIDFGAAAGGSGALSILAPDGKEVVVEAAALAPYADLVATAGDLRLDAAGDVLLPRAEQGIGTLAEGPGPLRVRVGGAAELVAGGDVALAHAGDLTLAGLSAGGDAAIRTVEGGSLDQTGAASVGGMLALDVAGDAALDRGDNAFSVVSGRVGGALAAGDADGFALADLRAGSVSTVGQGGAVALRDVATTGAISVEAASVSAQRLEAGGDLALAATAGAATGEDLQAGGALSLAASGEARLARFVSGSLDVVAGGAATVGDGGAGAARVSAGGDATLANLRLGEASVEAGGAVSALAIRAESLDVVAGGDAVLGAASVTGALSVSALGMATTALEAPAKLAAVTVAGVRDAAVGVDTDARLGDAAVGRQRIALAAGADAGLAEVAADAVLAVGGAARFEGGEGVAILGEAGGRGNRLEGPVTVRTEGDARIETAGALVFGGAEVSGDLSALSNADGAGEGGAGIGQQGAVRVGGLARFTVGEGGGDVTLDRADNAFATVALTAGDARLRDADGFAVQGATLSGRLTVGGGETAQAGAVSLASATAAGGAEVRAVGDVTGAGLSLGAGSVFASQAGGVALSDAAVSGLASVDAAGDAALSRVSATTLDVAAGGDAALSEISVDGALGLVSGGSATLDAATATTIDLAVGGDATLAAAAARGLAAEVGGDALLTGVAVETTLALAAGGSLSLSDVQASVLDLSAGLDASLADVAASTGLSLAAGRNAALVSISAGAMALDVGGALALSGATAGSLVAVAGRDATLDAVTVDAALSLAAGGDAALDTVAAGAIDVHAGGSILMEDLRADSLGAYAGLGLTWTGVEVEGAAVGEARGGPATLLDVGAQSATLSVRGDATVDLSAFGALTLTALGDAVLRDVTAETMTVAAGVDFGGGGVVSTLSTPGEGPAMGEGTAILARVAATEAEVSATADVRVRDSRFGELDAEAGRDGELVRVEADELSMTAARDLAWTDVAAELATGRAREGSAALSRATVGQATVSAGLDIGVADSGIGGLAAAAGRDLTLARLSAGDASASAGRDLSADDVKAQRAAFEAGRDLDARRLAARTMDLEAAGALAAISLSGETMTLAAGGAMQASRIEAGALAASAGGAMTLADLKAGEATLAAGGRLELARAQGGPLTAAAGATTLSDLSLARLEVVATGDLSAERVATAGRTRLQGQGVALSDLSAGGALEATAAGALQATRTRSEGATTLAAGGVARLDRVSAGRGMSLSADGAGGGDGPALTLRGVDAARLSAEAGGAIDLDGVATGGDATLTARAGDIRLGALEVGGVLSARAEAGAIRTQRGVAGADLWTVAGPEGAQGPSAPRGLPGEGDGELIERIVEAEVPAGPTTVAGRGFDDLVRVEGGAVFDAAGSVLLAAEDGGEGRDNDFRGGVGVSRARHVAISDANDLRIGAAGIDGLYNRVSGERLQSVHLRAGGDVTDAAGARIRTAGDVWTVAGGDVRLDSGLHAIGGAFAARAHTVEIATAGDLRLGPIQASGRLMALAGASGEGYASITQVGAARVTRLGMVDGLAADGTIDLAGPIRVDGDADFATGADPAKTAADRGADLILDDPTNVFGGDVSIRRIFGAVTLIEESAPGALHVDEHDAGWLRFAGFEAGGDVLIRTSDNVAFLGRLTGLTDDMDPAGPLAAPAAAGPADWRAQGGELAQEDLRLFLPDGTVFAIDATAGGADPSGGTVRFDRPVDGANALSSARDEDAAAGRAGAGALAIDAGSGGDVRFRDYVGASNPLGAVVIADARDVSLGHTFAGRDARPSDDPDRFLLQGEGQSADIFTSGPIVIDARGSVEIYMPAGLLEQYEDDDDYFGVNTPVLIYGDRTEPAKLSLFGYIGDSGQQAAGLYPIGPKGVNFLLNGCVIGDVQDCTGVSPPRVLNIVAIDQPEILNVEEEDLLELFVSYGNEELWGVPDGYFEDSDLARARAETNRQASGDEDDDGDGNDAQARTADGGGATGVER